MTAEAPPTTSHTGRTLITTLFVLFAGYCVVAVVGSMLRDLYAQPPPPAPSGLSPAERSWCTRRIAGLKNELESRASQFLQKTEPAHIARWAAWHSAWSADLEEVRSRCSGEEPSLSNAYERLQALHDLYAAAVDGVMRARTEIADQMNQLLERL